MTERLPDTCPATARALSTAPQNHDTAQHPARSSGEHECEIAAADGYRLAASVHEPELHPASVKGVVLLHPATGVPQSIYRAFAQALASHGFHVVRYDYRGIGRSAPPTLRGFAASMSTWIDQDVEGVTRWAAQRWPELPLLAVGHSIGGHAVGLSDSSRLLSAAALVASHAGCLHFIKPLGERLRVTALLKVIGPLTSHTLGYVPGRRLGIGENLPRGVALEWSRWTSLPRYFFDDPSMQAERRFARVTQPLLVLGFDDDPWATTPGIDLLIGYFTQATLERHQIDPRQHATGPIGHMGFFRRQHRDSHWPLVIDWLERQAAAARGK
ncbi:MULTISPECIES: alpha/beta fold hydrolase [unclassified Cobetia]|uniref:alpha/beta hydrolase family protein n=1 Tax=unclassified Cobetia TaxID=2609414 RepID=UPI002097A8F5|nr:MULTISPECIES: alpha/beta fold hydrolase [unclassified Cobetia]MCO7233542.1 alpha/beta fold hydrolase [Cobetia sp. Dlab-2-AX]MCO7236818.1 alpha/beta fold hydrolase [Cobetia sp. Dlab-2-U]